MWEERKEKKVVVRGKKMKEKKNLYVITCLILAANYRLRSLDLVLIFPLLGSLTLYTRRWLTWGPWVSEHTAIL